MNKYLMKAQNPYCISAFIYTEGPILSWPLYALKAQIAHLLWPSRAAQADSGLLRHHYGLDSARIGPNQVCYLGEQIQIVSRPSHTLNCWRPNCILPGPLYALKAQMYLGLHKQWRPQMYFGLHMHLRSQLIVSQPSYKYATLNRGPKSKLYLGLYVHRRPNFITPEPSYAVYLGLSVIKFCSVLVWTRYFGIIWYFLLTF